MTSTSKATDIHAKTKMPAKPQTGTAVGSSPLSPFEEMDLLFDRLSHRLMSRMGFPALADTGWPFSSQTPRVDLVDRGKELLLRAEVPGVAKEDLSISLKDGTVTIHGETRKESREDKGDYHRREISHGAFQRCVRLPADVDGEHTKASFKDGVLELVMPKLKESTGRHISIE